MYPHQQVFSTGSSPIRNLKKKIITEQIFFVENVPKNQLCASFLGSALRQ
jgi:hypothetical protein